MFERVKESLSELLTPEEAKILVEKVIAQDLLKEAVVPGQHYYDKTKIIPSKFNRLVSEQIDPIVKQCVEEWISDNEDVVLELINRTLERGILNACASALNYQLQGPLATPRGDITNVLTKLGSV